jgi:hypothetical protein
MKKHLFKNTIQGGSVRFIVFKEASVWYATALEFNITESGDDPREVLMLLLEAVTGYIKSVKKAKIRPFPLNQKTEEEYERLWKKLEDKTYTPIKSPYSVYTFGRKPIVV